MLISIAVASILATVALTVYAALTVSQSGGQTFAESMQEAWTNVAIGFSINYFANLIVLPLAGLDITPGGAFWIGCIFTAISIIRSFVIRRFFNKLMIKRIVK